MKKPTQTRPTYLPSSAYDDLPPITRLTRRVKALEFEVRGLTSQYERWVEGVGHLMCHMDATAEKLASMADELCRLDPLAPADLEALDF